MTCPLPRSAAMRMVGHKTDIYRRYAIASTFNFLNDVLGCKRGSVPARRRTAPRPAWPVYFLSAAFFSAGALDADFAIVVIGTMMWAYGVPFHITHGPPLVQSVGYASS